MKKFFKKLLIKSTAILCSAMLLFLSPCAGYLGASSMEYVQAIELAVAEGGAYILELIIALLASLSVGVAYENREAIGDAFTSYLETPDLIAVPMQDPCIQVYNDNTNTATDISWQDVLDSLHEFHDEAVDDLTGVYIKYCPALLNSIDDFIADVLSGDVVIPELSTELIDDSFSDFESIQNADGYYSISGYATYNGSRHGYDSTIFNQIFSDASLFRPFAVVENERYIIYRYGGAVPTSAWRIHYDLYDVNDSSFHSSNAIYMIYGDIGFGVNVPVFTSMDAAISAFETDDYSIALNHAPSIDSAIESDDIPPFTKSWRQGELERLLNSLDATGIGSYGRGISIDNWTSELPWIRLESLRKYSRSLDDLYRQMIDDIINENYDSAKGIPGTYSEAWEQIISEAWDNVEQSTDAVPGESEKDKPTEGEDEDKDDPEGGGGGSGDSNNDQEEPPEGEDDDTKTPSLSKNNIKHSLNRHMPSKFVQQLGHQSRQAVEALLIKRTFFNIDWTEDQVIEALTLAYEEALNNGISSGKYSFMYLGETIVIYLENGLFDTGYGLHFYTYDELYELFLLLGGE